MMKESKLVCGWGRNDSPVGYIVTGCPFYGTWSRMLQRRQNLADHPTYRDVTVCEEWKSFWAFKRWMGTKDWEGKELDKDLRIPGNKDYSPDACLFVDRLFNHQKLIDPRKYLDDHPYPEGVYLSERKNGPDKYRAGIQRYGKKQKWLGTFLTVDAASSEYRKKKAEYLRVLADSPDADCHLTKEALLRWADIYELEIVYLLDNGRWVVKHRQTLDSFSG
jgi:hypothetical protein